MPIVDTDLVTFGAANHPENTGTDASSAGGAIDLGTKVIFTDIAATDSVEAISSNAGDTMNLTVVGRNAAGEIVTEVKALNGTTFIAFDTLGAIERFLYAKLASVAAGTVTIRRATGDTVIATMEAGIDKVTRLFINSYSDPDDPKDYYEKFFWKNTHGTLSLLGASVAEVAGGAAASITFALADTKNDSESVANRLAVPADVTAFGEGPITVLTATGAPNLAAGEAIGVWAKLSLAAGNAPIESTWTTQLAGAST